MLLKGQTIHILYSLIAVYFTQLTKSQPFINFSVFLLCIRHDKFSFYHLWEWKTLDKYTSMSVHISVGEDENQKLNYSKNIFWWRNCPFLTISKTDIPWHALISDNLLSLVIIDKYK